MDGSSVGGLTQVMWSGKAGGPATASSPSKTRPLLTPSQVPSLPQALFPTSGENSILVISGHGNELPSESNQTCCGAGLLCLHCPDPCVPTDFQLSPPFLSMLSTPPPFSFSPPPLLLSPLSSLISVTVNKSNRPQARPKATWGRKDLF